MGPGGEAYGARLKAIAPELPAGVKRLLRRYPLHDAKIVTMTAGEGPYFSVLLRLDAPAGRPAEHIELRYRLAGGVGKAVELVKHEALAEDGKPFGWWLYDEFDLSPGPVQAVTHSILVTGGYELRLTFYSLSCRRLNFLLPPLNAEGAVDVEAVERLVQQPA